MTDDASKSPIAGAVVQALTSSATTGSSGSYTLPLAPAVYYVTASASGYVGQTQRVTVPAGKWAKVNFSLKRAPTAISGTVVANLAGLPISGATVSLGPAGPTTTTGPNGAFSFPSVTPGTYTITTSALLYRTATQSVSVARGQAVTVSIRLRTILGL